jgi:5-deoxy-glucuronate isomerase
MKKTMKKYAERIERNEINPHIRYDGQTSGLILDPLREEVPLETLGFGIYRLGSEFIAGETKEKEVVLVPQEGEFEAEVDGKTFHGKRIGGPFCAGPGKSNASALYIPCDANYRLRGKGEIAFFEAPAFRKKSPFYLPSQELKVVSRGDWIWRRDVIPLISPKDASSNLVVGETYNPPGFWSGTPPHQHDDGHLAEESDHEEVYYHLFHCGKRPGDQLGPYGVQVLMDGTKLMKAFLIGDKSIFAIPGGCHPVVASPTCELLYLWGLAGTGGELAMRDVPEFAYLKSFEPIFKQLEGEQKELLSEEKFQKLCTPYPLTDDQKSLLRVMLREKGYDIR